MSAGRDAAPVVLPDVALPDVAPPVVAVVGRPNVGKSTLVNRIVGRRIAIVEERPGVTRDRLELESDWRGRRFVLVDTGGVVERGSELEAKVGEQAWRAAEAADVVLFVLDVTTGATSEDEAVATRLRRRRRQVIAVANKADSARLENEAWELARLGLGDPVPVSALHGRGVGDLLDLVVERLPPEGRGSEQAPAGVVGETSVDVVPASRPVEDLTIPAGPSEAGGDRRGEGPEVAPERGEVAPERGEVAPERGEVAPERGEVAPERGEVAAVAIVGRPNVGKSTLFNRLVGEDRSIVHDVPGTTRDAIDTVVMTDEGPLRFIDTAGLRRRSRIGEGSEYYSLVRSLAAIDRADVALLVLDSVEGVTHQEQRLAERIDAAGSPIVIVCNKWDLLDTERRLAVSAEVEDRLGFISYAPVLRVSAKTGLGAHRLLPAVHQAIEAYHQRIPTARLNEAVKAAQAAHPAPGARVLYAVQGAVDPPTVTLFATRRLQPGYLRYIERSLRERFALGPSPLKLRVRVRS
jgi:GTP-binding protein